VEWFVVINTGHNLLVSGFRIRALLAMALIAVALSGCASPAWSGASYHGKAIRSAKDMSSAVATAQIAAKQYLDGRLTSQAADTIVSDAEQDAQGVLSAFGTRQPPDDASRKLFEAVDPVLQQAANDLTDLRIALRADDQEGISKALDELAAVSPKVQRLAGQS
jgi:hypothetical protein